jgi:nitroreductase
MRASCSRDELASSCEKLLKMTREKTVDKVRNDSFQDIVRRRRSVRKFEAGGRVDRDTLERIVDCGRWAPSGANVQCWDVVVVDEPEMRDAVTAVFLRQAHRLVDHAKGFPAVMKTYLSNTAAIIVVIGDPRWKVCFPQPTSAEFEREYLDNNEAIFLCSIGAAIQNIQLAVTAEGLTSAWLSGGGEHQTNKELSSLLGFPPWMRAYGTIPVGYPSVEQDRRYRRPLSQCLHWNGYQARQYRRHQQVDFYESTLRPFAMYRDQERVEDWPDRDERLGVWSDAFSTDVANPAGQLEEEADFTTPRVFGPATKRRRK